MAPTVARIGSQDPCPRGGVYQAIMLAAVAAVLTTMLAEPAMGGALTNKPPNEQIRLEYLPNQQSVLVTTNDGKWFGSVGGLTLYDQNDPLNTQIYVDLTDFLQHRASGKLSWDDHVKLTGIANVGGHLPDGWGQLQRHLHCNRRRELGERSHPQGDRHDVPRQVRRREQGNRHR